MITPKTSWQRSYMSLCHEYKSKKSIENIKSNIILREKIYYGYLGFISGAA